MDQDKLKAVEDKALVGVRQLIEVVKQMGDAPIDEIMSAVEAPVRKQVRNAIVIFEKMAMEQVDLTISELSEMLAGLFEKRAGIWTGTQIADVIRSSARETVTPD